VSRPHPSGVIPVLDRRAAPRLPAGMRYQPPLEVRRVGGRVPLPLGELAYGEGATLFG
jgi:hypothetical protein